MYSAYFFSVLFQFVTQMRLRDICALNDYLLTYFLSVLVFFFVRFSANLPNAPGDKVGYSNPELSHPWAAAQLRRYRYSRVYSSHCVMNTGATCTCVIELTCANTDSAACIRCVIDR